MNRKKLLASLLSITLLSTQALSLNPLTAEPNAATSALTASAATASIDGYTTYNQVLYALYDVNGSKLAVASAPTAGATAIKIPASVTNNGITYPVKTIREYAFSNQKTLKTMDLSSATNLLDIKEFAFSGCTALTTVTLPSASASKIRSLGKRAFYGCTALKSIDLSRFKNLTKIEAETFYNCSSLTSIIASTATQSKLTSIGDSAFGYCKSLKNLDLTKFTALKTLEKGSFMHCTGMLTAKLPDTITELPGICFYECTNLQTVTFPKNLKYIRYSCFTGAKLTGTVTLPSTIVDISSGLNGTTKTAIYKIDSSNPYYGVQNNVLFKKNASGVMDTLLLYPPYKTSTSYKVPVKYIDTGAFHDNAYLKKIDLTNYDASSNFSGATNLTNLEEIVIPAASITKQGGAVLNQYKDWLTTGNVTRINGETIVKKYASGKPYFNSKYASYLNQNFDDFSQSRSTGYELNEKGFLKQYCDYYADYVLATVTTSDMSPLQKAVRVQQWLRNQVIYDPDEKAALADGKNHVDASAFLNKKNGKFVTVCDGYARAYAIIMNRANIKTLYVSGGDLESNSGHAWNVIQLGGNYYHVDVCWDDCDYDAGGTSYFNNFLRRDIDFNNDGHKKFDWHTPDNSITRAKGIATKYCRNFGDINNDSLYNQTDLTMLLNYVSGSSSLTTAQRSRADIDMDGSIDYDDYDLLYKFVRSGGYVKGMTFTDCMDWVLYTFEK